MTCPPRARRRHQRRSAAGRAPASDPSSGSGSRPPAGRMRRPSPACPAYSRSACPTGPQARRPRRRRPGETCAGAGRARPGTGRSIPTPAGSPPGGAPPPSRSPPARSGPASESTGCPTCANGYPRGGHQTNAPLRPCPKAARPCPYAPAYPRWFHYRSNHTKGLLKKRNRWLTTQPLTQLPLTPS